jgi:hypothetical protein
MKISLLVLLILLPLFSVASTLSWQRQILTESQADQRTLLLVLDVPSDNSILQKVIFRRSFAKEEAAELQKMTEFYSLVRFSSEDERLHDQALTTSVGQIWPVTAAWDESAEKAYGQWMHDNVDGDFLRGSGIKVDCADYAITLRWIYAHDHGLPAGNQLAASGRLFGSWQSTTAWDQLPTSSDWKKDRRLKAALNYLNENTYTHSLFMDLYPSKIDSTWVSPGSIYLTLHGNSGHTRTLVNVGTSPVCKISAECIIIVYGNEPSSEDGFMQEFVPYRLAKNEGGFLRFRWPEKNSKGQWTLRASSAMPGYSLEQYTWDEDHYFDQFSQQMNLWVAPNDRFTMAAQNLFNTIFQRQVLTMRGYLSCSLVPCAPGEELYDEWSTPQRDQQLLKAIKQFQAIGVQADPQDAKVAAMIDALKRWTLFSDDLSTYKVMTTDVAKTFSSDPRDDIFTRWGLRDVDLKTKANAFADVASRNWNFRDFMVSQAQALCFKGVSNVAQCSARDPQVRKLSTSRLDQGFRKLLHLFSQSYAQLPETSRTDVAKNLVASPTAADFCPQNKDNMCTMYDLMILAPEHIQKMSSDPTAPRRARYGF